jgi:hypothetical protein
LRDCKIISIVFSKIHHLDYNLQASFLNVSSVSTNMMNSGGIKRLLILFLYLHTPYSYAYQSVVSLQGDKTDFQPANPVELLQILYNISSIMQCFMNCHVNVQCRTFVYQSETQECFLYEGSIETGNVITSSDGISSTVGGLIYNAESFQGYGLTCDYCSSSRYLTCVNNVCQCLPNTFWNGTMCLNQAYFGQTMCNKPTIVSSVRLVSHVSH